MKRKGTRIRGRKVSRTVEAPTNKRPVPNRLPSTETPSASRPFLDLYVTLEIGERKRRIHIPRYPPIDYRDMVNSIMDEVLLACDEILAREKMEIVNRSTELATPDELEFWK